MKRIFTLIISLAICHFINAQNIGINSTGAAPDASAILDVVSTSKGLLIPRVALTATNAAGPIASPLTSLLVYNTATAGVAPNNVIPGHYYWNGAAWIPFLVSSTTINGAWKMTGNSGTSAATNFIGTTDAIDWVMRTNNIERARISSTGNFGLGTSAFNGTNPEKLVVDAGTTTSVNAIVGKGSINSYLQLNIQNSSNGTSASSDVVATADNGSETTNYVDMGINSSTNNSGVMGVANDAYLYNIGQNFLLGTGTAAKSLVFMTGGTAQGTNERMRIDGNGNVGIGTTVIPTGGIGAAKLGLEGADGSMNGPDMQFTTTADDYPLVGVLPWTHDNSYILFDTYWDGATWRSGTSAGGNFRIAKSAGLLQFGYANVNTQGGAIASFSPGIMMNPTGNVGIGTSTFSGTNAEKLLVDAGTTASVNAIVGKGSINSYLQLNIQNQSNGTGASSDVVATADNGSETINYVDMGINGSLNSSAGVLGGANTAYLYATGNDFVIGNSTIGRDLSFYTTTAGPTSSEKMRILSSGNVGINAAAPGSRFDVNGSMGHAVTTTTTNLTLDATHCTLVITGGTPTITLPTAAAGNVRRIYVLVNQTAGARNIGTSTYKDFAGANASTVPANSSITIQSDGANWYRIR